MQLTLIRHGQTYDNVAHVLQGQTPGQLTPNGEEQARQLAEELVYKHFDAIICSDLKRTVDTALIINKKLQLPIYYDPLLRERNLGEYVGQPYGIMVDTTKPNVESTPQLIQRASKWLKQIKENHAEQNLLIVSHGFFLRVLQSVILSKNYQDILPMQNTEVRTFQV